MAIPDYQSLMLPVLEIACTGESSVPKAEADAAKAKLEAAGAMGKTLERPDYFTVRNTISGEIHRKIRDASGKVK